LCHTAPVEAEDHVDRLLARIAAAGVETIDLDVEGIVDRIGSINHRIRRAQEEILRAHDLTHADWSVLTNLRLGNEACRSSPGDLSSDLEVSSGAMTTRLDRLEEAGLVRRLPDPDDRRGVVVELTENGRDAWDAAADVQARREAFFARTLTKPEQKKLNELLRKLLLALPDAMKK
jgi:DNA-binding MarR family transcriptional regulator